MVTCNQSCRLCLAYRHCGSPGCIVGDRKSVVFAGKSGPKFFRTRVLLGKGLKSHRYFPSGFHLYDEPDKYWEERAWLAVTVTKANRME